MTEEDAGGRDQASSQPPSPPRRLVIADDHALVREGMRTLLAKEPDLAVVGEAANGLEAIELCRSLSPDLILMDVRMPEMDGLAAARRIRRECPKTSVLMVTSHESPDYLLKAVRAGAVGYVLKEATRQQLANAVRRALEGESPLNQELAMQLLRRLSSRKQDDRKAKQRRSAPPDERQEEEALPEPLTDRELDILRLLALGKTNREVARELWLSLSTVKRHVEHIIAKLGGSDRTGAAVRAVELGLLPHQEEEQK